MYTDILYAYERRKKTSFQLTHTYTHRDSAESSVQTDGAERKREPDSANWLVYNETNARCIRRFADHVVQTTKKKKHKIRIKT